MRFLFVLLAVVPFLILDALEEFAFDDIALSFCNDSFGMEQVIVQSTGLVD